MGLLRSIAKRGGKLAAPRLSEAAPGATEGFLEKVLDRAIAGGGPFDPAAAVAERALTEADGDVDRAIGALVATHVKLAGTQGFLTNIGGLVTAAVAVPANVTGVVLVQLRLHAAVATLLGHDLGDPGVRAAVLVTLLGHDETEDLVKAGKLPGNARWLAAGGAGGTGGTETSRRVATQVASSLIASLGGKQLASTVGKRVPLLGGVVGAATDARATKRLGEEAAADLRVD